VADDARVLQQAFDIGLVEGGYLAGIEVGEGLAEGLALVEDGQPAQAGLEALEQIFSNRRRSSVTGKPHSSSW
jgi:hypothetical protein